MRRSRLALTTRKFVLLRVPGLLIGKRLDRVELGSLVASAGTRRRQAGGLNLNDEPRGRAEADSRTLRTRGVSTRVTWISLNLFR